MFTKGEIILHLSTTFYNHFNISVLLQAEYRTAAVDTICNAQLVELKNKKTLLEVKLLAMYTLFCQINVRSEAFHHDDSQQHG
jgi:hypothetical protein